MRQPLLRHASRSLFIASAAPASARRLAARPSIPTSRPAPTCIQCQYLPQQRRHFADGRRNITPGSPPSNDPTPLDAPPPASQQQSPSSSPADPESAAATDPKQDADAEASTQPPVPPPDDPGDAGELPSASERRRSQISKRLTNVMDNLQGNIFLASQRINDLTGYTGIEALKRSITSQESNLQKAHDEVRSARLGYKQLVTDRAASQREVTTLLARKDTWTPIDLERFTSLYRSDHGNEHAVQEAAQRLADAERAAEQAAQKLNASILARYHEEQIWSDKIRRMSTWGTWGLMSVNVLLFLVFQLGFEPWRRERLTRGFEEKVRAALEKEREIARAEDNKVVFNAAEVEEIVEAAVHDLNEAAAERGAPADALVAAVEEEAGAEPLETEMEALGAEAEPLETETEALAAETEALPVESPTIKPISAHWRQPETWREGLVDPCVARFQDLFSEEKVSLRKQDITMVALEGLATGAAVAGLVVMYILRPN